MKIALDDRTIVGYIENMFEPTHELHETKALRTAGTRYYTARNPVGFTNPSNARKFFDAARKALAPEAEIFELVGTMPAFDCMVDGRKAVVYLVF